MSRTVLFLVKCLQHSRIFPLLFSPSLLALSSSHPQSSSSPLLALSNSPLHPLPLLLPLYPSLPQYPSRAVAHPPSPPSPPPSPLPPPSLPPSPLSLSLPLLRLSATLTPLSLRFTVDQLHKPGQTGICLCTIHWLCIHLNLESSTQFCWNGIWCLLYNLYKDQPCACR